MTTRAPRLEDLLKLSHLLFDDAIERDSTKLHVQDEPRFTTAIHPMQRVAYWIMIHAARDAVYTYSVAGKNGTNKHHLSGLRFWINRDYEIYAALAGVPESVTEVWRQEVIDRCASGKYLDPKKGMGAMHAERN